MNVTFHHAKVSVKDGRHSEAGAKHRPQGVPNSLTDAKQRARPKNKKTKNIIPTVDPEAYNGHQMLPKIVR